jgi:DNA mismatch repair ATPase MutS
MVVNELLPATLDSDHILFNHPWSGQLVDESETNDASSSTDSNPSMLLLTGPNYSGKSVYINS